MSIPSSPRRSRIAHFKAHFLVSVAGSAAVGLACGGQADIGPNGECVPGPYQQCNPPPAESPPCPESPAEIGSYCGEPFAGLTCEYAFCYGTAPMRRCSDATLRWEALPLSTCNPPPPPPQPCEATLPVPGSDCASDEVVCLYPGSCEGQNSATCRNEQWLVVYSSGPACNPPAVVPVCPEREIVTDQGCAYAGQECGREECAPGSESRAGHVCSGGVWQDAVLTCPPPGSARDAGG